MNKWLDNFAYRINISWAVFLLSGASALIIAVLTVGLQAVRTAAANPARSCNMNDSSLS